MRYESWYMKTKRTLFCFCRDAKGCGCLVWNTDCEAYDALFAVSNCEANLDRSRRGCACRAGSAASNGPPAERKVLLYEGRTNK